LGRLLILLLIVYLILVVIGCLDERSVVRQVPATQRGWTMAGDL